MIRIFNNQGSSDTSCFNQELDKLYIRKRYTFYSSTYIREIFFIELNYIEP